MGTVQHVGSRDSKVWPISYTIQVLYEQDTQEEWKESLEQTVCLQ